MPRISFRESASNQYATFEQIDSLMHVIRPSGWLWLVVCSVISITVLGWSVAGSIVTRVHGEGIMVHEGGVVTNVVAPEAGRLIRFTVHPGDRVKKDQVVAEIDQPLLRQEVEILTKYLARQKGTVASGSKAVSGSTVESRESDLALATTKLRLASQVVAGNDGIVADELAQPGMLVERFEPLLALETGADALEALLFFPSGAGKKIEPGQLVEISPKSFNINESIFHWGRVRQISTLPLSHEAMSSLIADDNLIADWTKSYGAPLSARVEILPEKQPRHNGSEKQTPLASGTLLTGAVRVKQQSPISIIIPGLAQWFNQRYE